jgi:hypothetical protein
LEASVRPCRGVLLSIALILPIFGFSSGAHAQFANAEVLVKELYGYYSDRAKRGFPTDERTVKRYMDRSMSILWQGKSSLLGYDFFVQGKDWRLSALKVNKGRKHGQENRVLVHFKNFDTTVQLVYVLVRNADGYRIFDVESEKNGTLRNALRNAI